MLPKALGFKLESLSTLQRRLLTELIQRRHPQYWSKFVSHKCSWQIQRETLEEFIQNHQVEIPNELARADLNNNDWKLRGSAKCTSMPEHYRKPWNGKRTAPNHVKIRLSADRAGKSEGVKLVGRLL